MVAADARRKFKELILWLAAKSETDGKFGATKLNKLLFFIDLEAMRRLGRPVTEEEYQKLENGPAPRSMLPVLRELESDSDIVIREQPVYDHARKKMIALREPDPGVFDAAEFGIMEECLRRYWEYSATDVSLESHDFIGWDAVDLGDTIPLGAVFISRRALSEAEREHGRKLAERYG